MLKFNNYDVVIFDCDGVILDSNELKINAMKMALQSYHDDDDEVDRAVDCFRNNFGRSRFHHVAYFIENILTVADDQERLYQAVLQKYAGTCKKLYLEADLTKGFEKVLEQVKADIHVASGSEQDELQQIFEKRGLSKYFGLILGSPTSKAENVQNIISRYDRNRRMLMVGDAYSDYEAAMKNHIEFAFYLPYSNVKQKMLTCAQESGFPVIESYFEVL